MCTAHRCELYYHPPQIEPFSGTMLAIYIGSSIGNFSPGETRTILRNLNSRLQAGDALLLGTESFGSLDFQFGWLRTSHRNHKILPFQ
jgi:uncharacterized SAM-dependent methyltransferase